LGEEKEEKKARFGAGKRQRQRGGARRMSSLYREKKGKKGGESAAYLRISSYCKNEPRGGQSDAPITFRVTRPPDPQSAHLRRSEDLRKATTGLKKQS